jgi:hypothetical protein
MAGVGFIASASQRGGAGTRGLALLWARVNPYCMGRDSPAPIPGTVVMPAIPSPVASFSGWAPPTGHEGVQPCGTLPAVAGDERVIGRCERLVIVTLVPALTPSALLAH